LIPPIHSLCLPSLPSILVRVNQYHSKVTRVSRQVQEGLMKVLKNLFQNLSLFHLYLTRCSNDRFPRAMYSRIEFEIPSVKVDKTQISWYWQKTRLLIFHPVTECSICWASIISSMLSNHAFANSQKYYIFPFIQQQLAALK